MKAEKMDRKITLQRGSATIDAYGTPSFAWANLATVPAQMIQRSTTEFVRAQGATEAEILVFRLRYFAGLTNADRLLFEGRTFNITEISELGRKDGIELRCLQGPGA
jgi:SPP1 family predicted phage head-tail adaptor